MKVPLRSGLPLSAIGVSLLCVAAGAVTDISAPPGRRWTPPARLSHPAAVSLGGTNLLRDVAGRPVMVAEAILQGGATPTWAVLVWRDSAWQDSLWSEHEVGGAPPQVVRGPDGRTSLVAYSRRTDINGYVRLCLWPLDPQISAPETVAVSTWQLGSFAYSAAFATRRRWVARIQQPPGETFTVRTFVSDAPGAWAESGRSGSDEWNCAIEALDDTTALLVYMGQSGGRWRRLEGTRWTEPQDFPRAVNAPRFVLGPAGGSWLVSEDREHVYVDAWNGAGWDSVGRLEALRVPGRGFIHIGWMEPSLETGRRPAIAWQENWASSGAWHSAAHVAWPMEWGWSPGYQVPDSDDMFLGPTVALDRDDNVWLSWWRRDFGGTMWTHSYVAATSGAPVVTPAGFGLGVEWTLSESAPGSWWAVLRAVGPGAFAEVARIRASEDLVVRWLDSTAPGNIPVRYRIRRESVDSRYRWESGITTYLPAVAEQRPKTAGPQIAPRRNPVGRQASLDLLAAEPGPHEVMVHDVSGRLVSRVRVLAGSGAVQPFTLDLSALEDGVYVVIARDARGRTSPVLKLARLD